jgi:putative transposase
MQNIDPKILAFYEKLKDVKSVEELIGRNGLITDLFKDTIQTMLQSELTDKLGYPKNLKVLAPSTSNKRNGSYGKKIRTSFGETQIEVPRDRNGEFEPQIIQKHQSNTNELERKIISMYGKGMTVSDLNEHLADMYGIEVTDPMISQITDKIIPQIQEWQARKLEKIYPIIYLDAIHFKVRGEGTVSTKAAYIVLGIDLNGKKDILGMWIGEEEGAKFWLAVLTELNSRGVEDILIACCDNLSGFSEAIKSVFPKTIIQKCVVHQIRNSLKYIVSKDQKAFLSDLKKVYRASTKQEAEMNLLYLGERWGKKYPLVIKSWENNWSELSAYFEFSYPIRKIIYTTNAIEGLNRQIRKVTKNKSVFPTRMSLEKILYLVTGDIMKRWRDRPISNWAQTISQFVIQFPDRINLGL